MAVLESEIAVDMGDLAWQHYYRLRPQIETPENIGKLILFDVDSGDYEIDDETDLAAVHRIQSRHPGSRLYALRIGYEAVCSFDGGLERLPQ